MKRPNKIKIKIRFLNCLSELKLRYDNCCDKFKSYFIKNLNIKASLAFFLLIYRFGKGRRERVYTGRIYSDNLKKTTGIKENKSHGRLLARKSLLESAVGYNNEKIVQMLRECSNELEEKQSIIISEGYIPIYAPMHFCSDRLAVVIAAMASKKETVAYSIYNTGSASFREEKIKENHGLKLKELHPNSSINAQKKIIKDTKEGLKSLVIFPDALPQCTEKKTDRVMSCTNVKLYDRSAIMHDGWQRIVRATNSKIINYYIYWECGRLNIKIFDSGVGIENIAENLEKALNSHGEQWLLWHYPSFFYFNTGK